MKVTLIGYCLDESGNEKIHLLVNENWVDWVDCTTKWVEEYGIAI